MNAIFCMSVLLFFVCLKGATSRFNFSAGKDSETERYRLWFIPKIEKKK